MNSGMGLGATALASLVPQRSVAANYRIEGKPKAKRVIFLFMAGGPSQLELFDYKPTLQRMDGQVIPPSYVENKRFAFLKKDAKLLGTRRTFRQWGDSGLQFSTLLPHLGTVADEVAVVGGVEKCAAGVGE